MDSTTVIQTASLRSDHYPVCVCVYVYTDTHTHTYIHSTVILQEGFLNVPLYIFVHMNQISLLTTFAAMHLYKPYVGVYITHLCV